MDSCRFNLPDWLPQNGITDSTMGGEMPDDLQLAGLLGKTLLERNGDLEAKLKRLEEFTEETLNTNKTLSRQVKDYKESLQFANKSCEHLETRLEESDIEIKELKLLRNKHEAALHVKERVIEDLQSLLETLESDNLQLQEDLKVSSQTSSSDKDSTSPIQLERSQSYVDGGHFCHSSKELEEVVDDLTRQLSDAKYQKSRIKQSADTITAENKKLKELLLKTESEIIDLQSQVKFLEEFNERSSEPATPIPPQSPSRRAFLMSSTSNQGMTSCPHCSGGIVENAGSLEDNALMSLNVKSGSFTDSDTLFTELQNELNTLQIRFDKLLQDCTCSASIPYKDVLLDTPPPCGEANKEQDKNVVSFGSGGKSQESSLKDLFEEVYASLKKSSIVADQLLTRRKKEPSV